MTPAELWQLVRVGAPAVAPDGTFTVVPATGYDVATDIATTLLFAIDAEGSEPALLTNPDLGSATHPSLDAGGERLAFVRKSPGSTHGQIHMMELGVGEALSITALPLGAREPRFIGDGRRLLCVGDVLLDHPTLEGTREAIEVEAVDAPRKRPRVTEAHLYRYWDRWLAGGVVPHLFVVDLEKLTVRDLMPGWTRPMDLMEDAGRFDVSPDGALVAFEGDGTPEVGGQRRSAIYAVPIDGEGVIECLTRAHPADAIRPRFTDDGAFLLYGRKERADYYADRVRLVRRRLADGAEEVLTEGWDRSILEFAPAADGSIWLTAEDRARTNLYLLEADGRADAPSLIAEGGAFAHLRAVPGGVFATYADLLHPPEVVRIARAGGLTPITRFNVDLLSALDTPTVSERVIEVAPGERVQAFVVEPPGERPEGAQLPLVHMIHGGPHSTFGDTFHFRWSARVFASWGFVVALTNYHGSESFGTEYRESILGGWGAKPARDVLAVTDALVEEGLVDGARMAITGGSFGGYLTAWLATQTTRFRCGVCHAGVYDLKAMAASDVIDWLDVAYGAPPYGDYESLRAFDPSAHAEKIETPLLVVHGEQDYRVPYTQGLALYNTLKRRGVPARLVLFEDENHWILKPRASLDWYREVEDWLRRWL